MEIKIIDNFLSADDFNFLKETMESPFFPWYYNEGVNYSDDKKYQFIHIFYRERVGKISENIVGFEDMFFSRLGVSEIVRAKANLNPRTFLRHKFGFHVDYSSSSLSNLKTSIFYVNTNNGGTKFKNGKFVKSVGNRMVIFNSELQHSGVTCNDKNRRIVINFNYI